MDTSEDPVCVRMCVGGAEEEEEFYTDKEVKVKLMSVVFKRKSGHPVLLTEGSAGSVLLAPGGWWELKRSILKETECLNMFCFTRTPLWLLLLS